MIQIQHRQTQRRLIALSPLHGALEQTVERAAIQCAGQRVDGGQALELFLHRPPVGDVPQFDHHIARAFLIERDDSHFGGEAAAVATFDIDVHQRPVGIVQQHAQHGPGTFRKQLFKGQTQQLLTRAASERLKLLIGVTQASFLEHRHTGAGDIEQAFEAQGVLPRLLGIGTTGSKDALHGHQHHADEAHDQRGNGKVVGQQVAEGFVGLHIGLTAQPGLPGEPRPQQRHQRIDRQADTYQQACLARGRLVLVTQKQAHGLHGQQPGDQGIHHHQKVGVSRAQPVVQVERDDQQHTGRHDPIGQRAPDKPEDAQQQHRLSRQLQRIGDDVQGGTARGHEHEEHQDACHQHPGPRHPPGRPGNRSCHRPQRGGRDGDSQNQVDPQQHGREIQRFHQQPPLTKQATASSISW